MSARDAELTLIAAEVCHQLLLVLPVAAAGGGALARQVAAGAERSPAWHRWRRRRWLHVMQLGLPLDATSRCLSP